MSLFAQSRLSVARRWRGMTQKELAERCGVSVQYMSFFENGGRTPQPATVHKIAFALGFPLSFFYASEVQLLDEDIPSFRARRSMTSQIRGTALASGEIAAEMISPDVNSRFILPKTGVPDLAQYTPEDAADLLRIEWKLGYGPIQNMVHLLESKGIEVYWIDDEAPSLDAFSFWRNSKSFVVLNSNKDAGERSRFDAAHELGHLVLHRHVDKLEGIKIESQADQFASAFLMPRVQFEAEFPKRPDLSMLYRLKKRWKVSVQAMIYRGKELGQFSEWQVRDAFKRISASGMRLKEKEPIELEQSLIHKMIFDSLNGKRILPDDYAKELNLNREVLFKLMPVARQYVQQSREIKRGNLRVVI